MPSLPYKPHFFSLLSVPSFSLHRCLRRALRFAVSPGNIIIPAETIPEAVFGPFVPMTII